MEISAPDADEIGILYKLVSWTPRLLNAACNYQFGARRIIRRGSIVAEIITIFANACSKHEADRLG